MEQAWGIHKHKNTFCTISGDARILFPHLALIMNIAGCIRLIVCSFSPIRSCLSRKTFINTTLSASRFLQAYRLKSGLEASPSFCSSLAPKRAGENTRQWDPMERPSACADRRPQAPGPDFESVGSRRPCDRFEVCQQVHFIAGRTWRTPL